INFIMSLLFTLVKGKEAPHVRQVEKSILQTIISNYYAHISENNLPARFSTFYEYVQYRQQCIEGDPLSQSSFKYLDIEEFLIVLKPFYDGPYQALLNSNAQQDLSEFRLVCFDLARIKGDTMIYPI